MSRINMDTSGNAGAREWVLISKKTEYENMIGECAIDNAGTEKCEKCPMVLGIECSCHPSRQIKSAD